MSFSSVLKSVIESSFPNHKLIHTSKGPGPELTFQIGNVIDGVKECLFIYKSNWDKSFYIHFRAQTEMQTKKNHSLEVNLSDIRLGHPATIKYAGLSLGEGLDEESPSYKDDVELKDLIVKRREGILSLEEVFFSPGRVKYAEISALCANIPLHYKKWHDIKDYYSYDQQIIEEFKAEWMAKPRKDVYEDLGLNVKEYDKFRCYLIMNKIADRDFLKSYLWPFWITRPFTKADFVKGDYYDCAQCNKFLCRGDYVKDYDNVFGEYYEFVCAKCLKKKDQIIK